MIRFSGFLKNIKRHRVTKREILDHNILVMTSNTMCPKPNFLNRYLPYPYRKYRIVSFYVYNNKRRGIRRNVGMISNTGEVKCTSYARFIFKILNGAIKNDMQIDHIDGNPINDAPLNLQVLTKKENIRKYRKQTNTTRFKVDIICYICHKLFSTYKNLTFLGGHPSDIKTCCRRCGGILSHMKMSKNERLSIAKQSIVRIYRV